MGKVICAGETVYDILIRDGKPLSANPGGSAFNSAISLGRAGLETCFLGEIGDDEVGKTIAEFLSDNGVHPEGLRQYRNKKSTISLAMLDSRGDAHYSFYRDDPDVHLPFIIPEMHPGDVVLISSYYAVKPELRDTVKDLLAKAHAAGALVYYDINFRPSHAKELDQLKPAILENIASSDVVRGSVDDLNTAFGGQEPSCPVFIRTDGPQEIVLRDGSLTATYTVAPLEPVSTIGAGDSFNAGICYGLVKEGAQPGHMSLQDWDRVIAYAMEFSRLCCLSMENYIPGLK